MRDSGSGYPPGTDSDAPGTGSHDERSSAVPIDATRAQRREAVERALGPDDCMDIPGEADDDDLPDDEDAEPGLGFDPASEDSSELGVDCSPWAPLHVLLDATEPEEGPGERPFSPSEGVERAHALELRAESMRHHAGRGARRCGELDRTEVGLCDENRDVVAGRDRVDIDGLLEEHTGHGLVHIAGEVEVNVSGPLTMRAHLEDNIIMAGVMRDELAGGTLITAAMSDDMAAGLGLRCTAPLDVWVHGLVGMEERPGTCAADVLLVEMAGTLYEREYGPSAHAAAVARLQGTVATTMKTGFRPLMKVALGVRNLIPGGGGGGGGADASPPAAPPVTGAGASETAGATTLGAVEGGGALGRGVAGGDDTDEIASVVRTAESASEGVEVEELHHPASTADNLDDLARVDGDADGYQQVADIYDRPVPDPGAAEPDGDSVSVVVSQGESLDESSTVEGGGARQVADADDAPPLGPEPSGAEPSSDAASPASGAERREPPPLDLTEPGTEDYDFRNAYGSLHDRNQFYRQEMNLRGNFFMREYLADIDARAFELFTEVGGSADEVAIDNFGYRTTSVYDNLEVMAEEAELAGRLDEAADIRAAMDEIEGMVNASAIDAAGRADEFSGVAIGSQRGAIDPNIDVDKLRSWLLEQELKAEEDFGRLMAEGNAEAAQAAGWERAYYNQLIVSLDAGVNPLAYSNEEIAVLRLNKVEPYYAEVYAQFADEIAAAAAEGYEYVIPRPSAEDEMDLYIRLQELLVATLSDPEFFLSAEDVGLDAYSFAVRARIEAGAEFLGPDSLRPVVDFDIAQSLPAGDSAGSVGYVDAVRDRSFSRSALAASEETLERQALAFAEGNAGVAPEPSFRGRRAPLDNVQAPIIDDRTGGWVPDAHRSTPSRADAVGSPAADVRWESGVLESGEPEAGVRLDAATSGPFEAVPEPRDVEPERADEVRHGRASDEDASTGSATARTDGMQAKDANPTGTVPGPEDSAAGPDRGELIATGSPDPTVPAAAATPAPAVTGVAPNETGTGAPGSSVGAGAVTPCASLYADPASFEGRSLEGASRAGDRMELARAIDGAEMPIAELPRADTDGRPVADPYADVDDAVIRQRLEWAQENKRRFNDGSARSDSVWSDTFPSGESGRRAATGEANARWSECVAAQRSATVSFGDDPHQVLYRGAEPPNTVDRAHAAHFVPRPGGPVQETGFGRLSQAWDELPFSHRERIVNALQRAEALTAGQISALESGLEGYRAAGGALSSSQCRAMVEMIADLRDRYRHARWHLRNASDRRLLQLIEMLDWAAM